MAVLQSDYLKGHDCETAQAPLQKSEGCLESKPKHERWTFDGYEFDRCPAYYVKRAEEWLQDAFGIWRWKNLGFLPWPGTWMDQPNKVIEVLGYIDYLMEIKIKSGRKTSG